MSLILRNIPASIWAALPLSWKRVSTGASPDFGPSGRGQASLLALWPDCALRSRVPSACDKVLTDNREA